MGDVEDPCRNSDVLAPQVFRAALAVPTLMTLSKGLADGGPDVEHLANLQRHIPAHDLELRLARADAREDRPDPTKRRFVGAEAPDNPRDQVAGLERVDGREVAQHRKLIARYLRKQRALHAAADGPEEGDVVDVAQLR